MPTFKLYMTTCPARHDVMIETIDSLRRSDWDDEPVIISDDSNHPDVRTRINLNAFRLLTQAVYDDVDYILYTEDDVEFNRHLRHNLSVWEPLANCRSLVASLYEGGKPFRPINNTHLRYCEHFAGAQAILIRTDFIPELIHKWSHHHPSMMPDIRVYRSLIGTDQPYVQVHHPNLVQHRISTSTWAAPQHFSTTFDLDFKA